MYCRKKWEKWYSLAKKYLNFIYDPDFSAFYKTVLRLELF